ncbi:methionine--tRNA ligase [Alphaproteobacteria bacterium]|nr:methionine--tRNA ligase [Alphaproteobacteria bacterium]
MNKRNKYYLTTAISYVNGPPHLGHAYEVIASDTLARFKYLSNVETFFLTGTDEHGEKNVRSAEIIGMSPSEFTSNNSDLFEKMTKDLNISNNDFIRTSDKAHHISAQSLWNKLLKADEIYLGTYGGWYSVRDEAYISEDEVSKTAKGKNVAPSGAEVEWVEEPSYFFRLSKWTEKLLNHYNENINFIKPISRKNEVVNFVKKGLKDISISRKRLKWGIKVPNDDEHVMYVWLDALTNYITGLGYPDLNNDKFKKFWPADIHIIGKDIVRFHAVYWPAFLMAANIELPKQIFCHGFLNIEGNKMSKSLGNVLSPNELISTYGIDQLRYFLLREVPFGQDGSFSHTQIIQRINGDLANDYGNLAQRVLSMVYKNCDQRIPNYSDLETGDIDLLDEINSLYPKYRELIEQDLAFHLTLTEIWKIISKVNRYIDTNEPWVLKNSNIKRMQTVLFVSLEIIRNITLLLQPFMPKSAEVLLNQLSVSLDHRKFNFVGKVGELKPGKKLPKPVGIFPRIENN